ncbi:FKBP-type peptidyl-prolyl cis-trans isomerase [Sphingosinicella microcystinivorans]|uniref:FKBP-type peptidyl-prolyl cis-trans isomerase n=1 Tax=Sphingosinicella microcystinivorans TaxID=335406 RepID=UPI0022F3E4C2|nr:FKBP-type peptidyl-prolyl cis-trans isomerase [Sphingosinicella microcystinivorans]WBX82653.1 FKBP-type peptidyl-prolyl cis-trans isomerase [Sphingosinicella microcystinivorans]
MATVATRGSGLGRWVLLLAVLFVGMGALAWAGTQKFAVPANMQTTASGLMYEVIREGDGEKPTAADVVLVHYEGRLLDGTVFDSSYQRGQPAAFPLQGLIPGWEEGIQLMPKGSKYRFRVPPQLAYGAEGAGGVIPPNATLEFDVELLEIAPREALEQGMPPQDPQQ